MLSASSRDDATVSVVTVCLNSKDTIARTLESVLAQTSPPQEYVVVDGASSDGTLDLITRYRGEFRARDVAFTFLTEPDRGLYDAMNKGVALSTGEWVHFLNSDDVYCDDTSLEKMRGVLRRSSADVVYGRMLLVDSRGDVTGWGNVVPCDRLGEALGVACCVQQPAAFYRRRLLQARKFDTRFRVSADYEYWHYLLRERASFEFCPIPITKFLAGSGVSTTRLRLMLAENIRIAIRYRLWNRSLLAQVQALAGLQLGRLRISLGSAVRRR